MAEANIEIGTPGIKNALKKYDIPSAISEFVWNGFDADASTVDIEYDANEIGNISELRIVDNGLGIPLSELHEKFKPFLHTNKVIDPTAAHHGPSATHGKNGIGRLTFFKFALLAEWDTVYKVKDDEFRRYKIHIDESKLNKFLPEAEVPCPGPTGTIVKFTNIIELTSYDFDEIIAHLIKEFAWFLELKSPFVRTIRVNGNILDYASLMGEKKETIIKINERDFKVKYIRWNDSLRKEYSRYYFIGSDNCERAKKTTTFNLKGDDFHHSLYVVSDYFNTLAEGTQFVESGQESEQISLPLLHLERDETFSVLIDQLESFLRSKRTPFLRKRALQYVKDLENEGSFPPFSDDPWEQHRKRELKNIVLELYEADPRIFRGLNGKQKQTILRLFSLIMDSSEREQLLRIIEQVINLDSKDRANLAKILESSQLSNLIATIKLIEDRFRAVDELKKMVFNSMFGANERDHLQTHIESHYWLFGEQYHLVTSAEADFVQALRKYIYILRGEESKISISHPDKNKEMDIFAVRWLPGINQINNIVLELKHPNLTLSSKELEQVKQYMSVVLEQPEFNASNMTWEFYLVGNKYNNYIEGELESNQAHGEKHLVYKRSNYKIYVLTWSEVVTNFELRHKFLLDKLKIEREKLSTKETSADEILIDGHKNSAISHGQKGALIEDGKK